MKNNVKHAATRLICAGLSVFLLSHAAWAQRQPRPEEVSPRGLPFVDVFNTGKPHGYRIPALVTTTKGTLLAFCERRIGLNDHAQNDIVLKRSFDGGKTWSPEQVIADMGGDSLNDPCVVVDRGTGRILLLFIRFPQGYHTVKSGHTEMAELGYGGPRNTQSFFTWSDDDGATWADPIDITKNVRRKDAISVGSPGRGIQLTRGKHKGRLLLPIYETIPSGTNQRYWRNCAAISDDGGRTWRLGRRVPRENVKGYGNEAQLVELADGSVMINCRSQGGARCRQVSVSRDGGETWESMREEPGLPTVPCMGSVLRYTWPEDGKSRILAAVPSPEGRKHGKVYVSFDEGKTWPVSRTIYPGGYAYSCLTVLEDGRVGCLYERDGYKHISFATFGSEWLDPVPDEASAWTPPASLESVPSTRGFPDVFVMANGQRVKNANDWRERREEIEAMMQYYQYGPIPPRPDKVTAVDVKGKRHRSGKGTEE